MPNAFRNGLAGSLLAVLPVVLPAMAAEPLPFKSPAVDAASVWSSSAYLYTNSKNTLTTDPNTSAQVDVSGGIGVLEYRYSWFRLAAIGNVGNTHITYQQVLQDTFVNSRGLGLRASIDTGPFVLSAGGSGARNDYESVLQNSTNSWGGSEREFHVGAEGRLHIVGPVWISPSLGFRHLELKQDAHMLGTSIIPGETRTSDLLFGGLKLELEIRDQLNNVLRPWAFGGVTHEYNDQAPLGPSVFLAERVAGNQFVLYPAGTTGVPAVFPSPDTTVFGLGFDLEFWKALTIRAAYYREFNNDFDSTSYKLGAAVRW